MNNMDDNILGDRIDHNLILELYKLYVEMADRISQRRQSANNFFLSINTAIIGGSAAFDFISSNHVIVLVSVMGLIISFMWSRSIRSYKEHNSAKFAVIHEIETRLPIQMYKREWETLKNKADMGEYHPFSNVEMYIPRLFFVIYLITLIYALWPSLGFVASYIVDYFS